jgi:MOSC domain-containing protein YiiM
MTIVSIHITDQAGGPMRSIPEVLVIAGKGLEGDRYASAQGTYSGKPSPGQQVTLIEAEAIEALDREGGVRIEPGTARRNLVTRGVALNHLVGREFRIGEAVLRGVRLCEPCGHMEKLTQPGARAGLVHRGGLRADIVKGGRIRVGQALDVTRATA